jgi:hypothetical protein
LLALACWPALTRTGRRASLERAAHSQSIDLERAAHPQLIGNSAARKRFIRDAHASSALNQPINVPTD